MNPLSNRLDILLSAISYIDVLQVANIFQCFLYFFHEKKNNEETQERLVDRLEHGEQVGRGSADSLFTAYLQVFINF